MCEYSAPNVMSFSGSTYPVEVEGEGERKTTSDLKTEIQKLFSSLRTSPRPEPTGKATKPRGGWRDFTRAPPTPGGHDPTTESAMEVLKELGAWSTLHEFCTRLPVFEALERDKAFLSGCVRDDGGTIAPSLATLIERYVYITYYVCDIQCALWCVSMY